ncbi:MAG: Crp/Fnr family transcriptional regulator [Armatimonadetes bacterium]|nr:Crp/Fnr family transcriptional regulator [Armatimonadota bacterium]
MIAEQHAERLRHVPLLAVLEDSQREQLARRAVPRTFEEGEQIFLQGNPGDALYFITEGSVRISIESESGREVTLAIRREGSFFGEMALIDGKTRSASAYAHSRCKCLVLLRDDFQEFVERTPRAALSLLVFLSMRLREASEQIEDLALRTVRQRLAAVLAQYAVREGEPDTGGILLPKNVNYRLLTGLLCTSRESVSRAASDLVDEGRIERQGRRFRVIDLDGLHEVANESV